MADTTPQEPEQPNTIVTSDAVSGRPWRQQPKWLFGAIIAVVLVAGIAGTYALIHKSDTTTGTASKTAADGDPATAKTETVSETVQDLKATGDYDKAQKLLDGELAVAKTDSAKGALYEQKSSVANNAGDFQAALDDAAQAEKLHPTQTSAYLGAISAEALGQNKVAAGYYQKALDRLTAEQKKKAPDLASSYSAKVKELNQ